MTKTPSCRKNRPKPRRSPQAPAGNLWSSLEAVYEEVSQRKKTPTDHEIRRFVSQALGVNVATSSLNKDFGNVRIFADLLKKGQALQKAPVQRLCGDLWDCRIVHANSLRRHEGTESIVVFAQNHAESQNAKDWVSALKHAVPVTPLPTPKGCVRFWLNLGFVFAKFG